MSHGGGRCRERAGALLAFVEEPTSPRGEQAEMAMERHRFAALSISPRARACRHARRTVVAPAFAPIAHLAGTKAKARWRRRRTRATRRHGDLQRAQWDPRRGGYDKRSSTWETCARPTTANPALKGAKCAAPRVSRLRRVRARSTAAAATSRRPGPCPSCGRRRGTRASQKMPAPRRPPPGRRQVRGAGGEASPSTRAKEPVSSSGFRREVGDDGAAAAARVPAVAAPCSRRPRPRPNAPAAPSPWPGAGRARAAPAAPRTR